jgi:putative transposase
MLREQFKELSRLGLSSYRPPVSGEVQVVTVCCKLEVSEKDFVDLYALSMAFAGTCNFIENSVPKQITNSISMQKLIYNEARKHSPLKSQHVIQAIRRVSGNRKVGEPPVFNVGSVSFDVRNFTLSKDWKYASLTTLDKRVGVKLLLGKHQLKYLKKVKLGWCSFSTSATLALKDNTWYLHLNLEHKANPSKEPVDYLGIDLGRRDIASLSSGKSFSGEKIEKKRKKHALLRKVLQKKASRGTRSSRRRCRELQKQLRGKEQRYQRHLNHCISKAIVAQAKRDKLVLVMEDLTGIRERLNDKPNSREQRFLTNSWSFYQFKLIIQYKAKIAGVRVLLIDPRYTSQTCHKCLHIHPEKGKSYRNGKNFKCDHCGWSGDADYNASNVIKLVGIGYDNLHGLCILTPEDIEKMGYSVNVPRGTNGLSCSLRVDSQPTAKLRASESPIRHAVG